MAIKHNFFNYLLFSDAVGGIGQTNTIHLDFHLGILRNYWLGWARGSLAQVVWAQGHPWRTGGGRAALLLLVVPADKGEQVHGCHHTKHHLLHEGAAISIDWNRKNPSLVAEKKPSPPPLSTSSCVEAAVHLLKENPNRDSI